MPLNGTIWIIMQHAGSVYSRFVFDLINLIYQNLFNHQPLDGFLVINTIKLFAKIGI